MTGKRGSASSRADSDGEGTATTRRRRPGGGRRRDPDIDDRVLVAARRTYAELGWSGFHFDRVARAAQVSRDVLYRRYSDREALLLDALANATLPTVDGQGTIRDQLMRYARDIYAYFTSPQGIASLRIHLEAAQFPDLYQTYRERVIDPNFEVNIAALDNASRYGELRQSIDAVAALEAIGGGLLIHALYSQHAGATHLGASTLTGADLDAVLAHFVALALENTDRP
ncbi:TetR-like C-terminal domain-containing protein [Mycobacterium sp. CVI_P3]|uniref:TetR-like C-terminal domain-containing protein n=1 Tax=Mycobacterium pinniadriaticum TaxID=2994102 RepID=A0ABT3SC18_9MYCO|nr:TetR-like C-terminal domain-containing protein [Mycobacterium pinniadriaticum]MCX2930641.1 TetR-like C-terminal domain-containing protein [Mycobacterium pinniadriaticum]MCX2937065.1 TetR-like C-terminal domain-containing protein [Mycobacterium pinniadriaticum]